MKKLLTLLALSVAIISCDKHEPPTFDNVNGQTLAYFDTNSSSLGVVVDDMSTVDISIDVTTISPIARTVSVSVDLANSTADPNNYSVPSTMTIPANSHRGILTVTGIDNSIETTPESIVLNVDSVTGGHTSSGTHTISMFQICPVNAPFTGMYLIEQVSPYLDGPTFSDNTIVELTNPNNDTSRVFDTANYPDYCGTPVPFTFNLVCNQIIVPTQNNACPCSSGTDWFGPATTPESYDPNDDSVFLVTFADDVQGDCAPVAYTTYRFTKQ